MSTWDLLFELSYRPANETRILLGLRRPPLMFYELGLSPEQIYSFLHVRQPKWKDFITNAFLLLLNNW